MFGDGNGFNRIKRLFMAGRTDTSLCERRTNASTAQYHWRSFLYGLSSSSLVFCGTAATIVSGIARRIKIYILIGFICFNLADKSKRRTWILGGGFLASLGMWDFAGERVVHSVSAVGGIGGVIQLGPRVGKYTKDVRSLISPITTGSCNDRCICIVAWLVWI